MTYGPPAPADEPETRWDRVRDAIGWGVAGVVATVADAGYTWRAADRAQRADLICDVLLAGMVSWLTLTYLPGWLAWAGPVVGALLALGSLAGVSSRTAERRHLAGLLERAPTGAPRIARIQCPAGYTHTFSYSDTVGWEEIGPAQHADTAS